MKLFIKITAFTLSLMLLLFAAGCSKENDPKKIVVARVNGENIYRSDFDVQYQYALMAAQYTGRPIDETDEDAVTDAKNEVLEGMIQDKVVEQKARELGFDKFSQEKLDEFNKQVDEEIQQIKDGIRAELEAERESTQSPGAADSEETEAPDAADSEETETPDATSPAETETPDATSPAATETSDATNPAETETPDAAETSLSPSQSVSPVTDEELQKEFESQLKQYGYGTEQVLREQILDGIKKEAALTALQDSIKAKLSVSDDEIKAWYDENLKIQQDEIKADISKYESYDIELYKPEGMIKVLSILIAVDEEKSITAKGLYDEGKEEDAWAVLKAEFERIQPKAEEVLAKVKAGEDFAKLMETYGEDPGMKEEPAKTEGYTVKPGDTDWVKEFTEAALKLKNVGDTSDLVKTVFGYHIIKKIGDVPSGPIPLEEKKEEIKTSLLDEMFNTEWANQKEAWTKAAKKEYFRPNLFVEVKYPEETAAGEETGEAPAAS